MNSSSQFPKWRVWMAKKSRLKLKCTRLCSQWYWIPLDIPSPHLGIVTLMTNYNIVTYQRETSTLFNTGTTLWSLGRSIGIKSCLSNTSDKLYPCSHVCFVFIFFIFLQAVWALRERLAEGLLHDGYCYKYDVSLPQSVFYQLVHDMQARLAGAATRVIGYGHVGDGKKCELLDWTVEFTVCMVDEQVVDTVECTFLYHWNKICFGKNFILQKLLWVILGGGGLEVGNG